MVGSSLSEDFALSRRGGVEGHHKPIRSRHQQFVSLVQVHKDQEFPQNCNGPSTACQSRHSPSRSIGDGEEVRESSGSHVRWRPAVDALRAKLKKVQSVAVVPAWDVQMEQCESFISRSERWLAELYKQHVVTNS